MTQNMRKCELQDAGEKHCWERAPFRAIVKGLHGMDGAQGLSLDSEETRASLRWEQEEWKTEEGADEQQEQRTEE